VREIGGRIDLENSTNYTLGMPARTIAPFTFR